jgi:hypothetical protein
MAALRPHGIHTEILKRSHILSFRIKASLEKLTIQVSIAVSARAASAR